MTIQFFGVSCFKITTKIGNEEVVIVTDPYSEKVGKLPRNLAASIVTVSRRGHEHHNNLGAVAGMSAEASAKEEARPFIIEHPGEYEVKGVPVYGIPAGKDTIYHYLVDDMRVVHLGGLKEPLTDDQLAQIGEVDVLMIPVGGGDVLTASAAADLVTLMEPRIVIPMHYKMKDLTLAAGAVEPFLKETGAKVEETDKLKISKKDLPQEETRVAVIKPA